MDVGLNVYVLAHLFIQKIPFFFFLHHEACRILVTDQGSHPCPLQ